MTENKLKEKITELKKLYPNSRSAIMPSLHFVQQERGYISREDLHFIAKEFCVTEVDVRSVISFYTMYKTKLLGRYHIRICRSLVCELHGSKDLQEWLQAEFGSEENQPTKDGLWSYEFMECLGACDLGPVVLINDTLYEKMTLDKLQLLKAQIEESLPELNYIFE